MNPQITALNSNSDAIADNVPDELALEIPRPLLLGFSNNGDTFRKVNKKKWKRQQVQWTQKRLTGFDGERT